VIAAVERAPAASTAWPSCRHSMAPSELEIGRLTREPNEAIAA
jgi:hypothetical protein